MPFAEYKDRLSVSRRTEDEVLLASLGYKQVFKRDFSPWELFGLAFSIVGVVQSIAAVLLYAIPYGGPVSMVWGWLVCSVFLMCIAGALAELGSSAPTSGGLYYWTFKFSSPRYRQFLSWLIGYTNTIGYISGVAGTGWGTAVQIMAAITIGTNGRFVPTNAQIYGVYCALLVCLAILASSATKVIAKLQTYYVALNIILCFAVIIALPASTPKEYRNDASFAFGHFENLSSYPNGYAFILSFLAPLWTVGGFDSSVHISEEAKNASIAVPFALLMATGVGCLLGWVVNIVLVFNMGKDLPSIVENPIGQPMATIFFNSLGQKGTLALWSFIIATLFMCSMDILVASSRQTYAFSRDGGLPFSKLLSRIRSRSQTPANAVYMSSLIAILLGLLSFAGPAAIGAVFTMSVVCQYICYTTPIVARYIGGQDFTPGPFTLGLMGPPIAISATVFMVFMIVVLLFPSSLQVSPQTMNYSVVVVGGTILLSVIYYFFPKYGGVHWFKGPVSTVVDEIVGSGSEKNDKLSDDPGL